MYRICGSTLSFAGVEITILLHPAIFAGIAIINKVEGKTAVPPGMYNPTLLIGR